MSNMQDMMKQAQALQGKMEKVQKDLDDCEISATVGGVMIELTGKMDVRVIEIDPEQYYEKCGQKDFSELQEHLEACFINVKSKVEEHVQNEMQKATGGMDFGALGLAGS